MQVLLRQGDSSVIPIEIPETTIYPDVLISAGRAFKIHPETGEYIECSVYNLHSNAVITIDYLTACIALVKASEHLNQLMNPNLDDIRSNALTWRLRCATEAITLIRNKSPREIEEYLQIHYPTGM